jgi:hypothetical protein
MKRVVIVESALRDFLSEIMDSSSHNSHLTGDMPVRINPVVAPDAPEVDPTNNNFVPQNKAELLSALRMLCDVTDDEVPEVWITLKDAMQKQEEKMSNKSVEESIKSHIRNILRELKNESRSKKAYGISESQSANELQLRHKIRKFIAEASYEQKRDAGDRVWANLPPVTRALPPVKKIPAGESGRSGTVEQQRAAYEKNVNKLQSTFENLDFMLDEEVATAASFFIESFEDLNFEEAAEAYALAFNEAKEAFEEEGVSFAEKNSAAAVLTSKTFKELFEAYSAKEFEEYAAQVGDRARRILSESLSKKLSGIEDAMKKRAYAASDVTNSTLAETAEELKLSIAMIKKVEARALGVFCLGLKAADSLNI